LPLDRGLTRRLAESHFHEMREHTLDLRIVVRIPASQPIFKPHIETGSIKMVAPLTLGATARLGSALSTAGPLGELPYIIGFLIPSFPLQGCVPKSTNLKYQ
jgi:hypothetical protein